MGEGDVVRDRIDRYLRLKFYTIEGYMSRLDAFVFREILVGQIKSGISGSLVEIGVHYGRSFFVLASGRSGDESSLGVDLFEDDELYKNPQAIGRLAGFNANCQKLHFSFSSSEIMKQDSLKLSPDDIVRRVGRVRFFSVDGGHMYQHLANDLLLAAKVMVPGGIISVDDILNPLWPEVSIATFDWLRSPSVPLVPFLSTQDKLYICNRDYADFYRRLLDGDSVLRTSTARNIAVLGHPITVLLPSLAARWADRMMNGLVSIGKRINVGMTKTGAAVARSAT
jgi:Methyltransferase domain